MPNRLQTILLIEDDLLLQEPVITALSDAGYAVVVASDGKEGLETGLREHPDLILLDILMPEMDGLEVMRAIRRDEAWGTGVPIILMTNLGPDEERIMQAITECEPAYYLIKSDWKLSEVVSKVQECLREGVITR